ncbi:STAS domain-containing protein [Streptomyces alboniger]|uniref:Anti-sigma factor antagonist n=1 Tax=Streptomyces alboniger TaxID=132473 RepID=A0A5J6HHZ7_STRAD|nr:STAS domain-containing protein [Streptomyces alboniger]QEV16787.1 anti-sigma factor antagonist [Streptomyces alboniger]
MRQEELSGYARENLDQPRVYGLDRTIVIELHGEIDLVAYQRMAPLFDAVAAGPEPVVVVDLSKVGFFDCSGISLLMRAHRRVSDRGGVLRVVCTHPLTLRMLRLTELTGVLSPAPTVAAARASLGDVTQRDA